MPELPEVEVTRQGLLPHVIDRRVIDIYRSPFALRNPVSGELLGKHLRGATITGLHRRAKYLLFRFADKTVLIIHLGMTGKLGVFNPADSRAKHDHFTMLLSDNMEVRYNDARRFGTILIWPPEVSKKEEQRFFGPCGPEPLESEFNAQYLYEVAQKKRTPIKNFLMDSRIVVGIGNIYANEILFETDLHPGQKANTITLATWQKVVTATQIILRNAIAAGGTTISDFLNAGGKPGYFQIQLKVYGKTGEACEKCSSIIVKKAMAGRASFFCPQCQRERKSL
ncbi:MAG: bifunctional DNA-formamidopyrimidine glycosylase/DNA-(apurinic or apyrimidinic site) lyase [Desulfobulbaceae bacterium]|nr:bifunctional DNA-formamidopyrimidine glycosylase/DNA-(apurinic or apyrimidinic site) lyase [Desulfobulbaceae bacterium]